VSGVDRAATLLAQPPAVVRADIRAAHRAAIEPAAQTGASSPSARIDGQADIASSPCKPSSIP
jgi:hypothetical protein